MKKIPKHSAAKRARIYHLLAEMIGNRPQFNRLDQERFYVCPMLRGTRPSLSTVTDLSDEFPEFFLLQPRTLIEYHGNSYSWFDIPVFFGLREVWRTVNSYMHPDAPTLMEANDARITALLLAEQIARDNDKRYPKEIIKVADPKPGRTYPAGPMDCGNY